MDDLVKFLFFRVKIILILFWINQHKIYICLNIHTICACEWFNEIRYVEVKVTHGSVLWIKGKINTECWKKSANTLKFLFLLLLPHNLLSAFHNSLSHILFPSANVRRIVLLCFIFITVVFFFHFCVPCSLLDSTNV